MDSYDYREKPVYAPEESKRTSYYKEPVMKSFECYACLAQSTLDMVRMCATNPEQRESLVRDVYRMLSEADFSPNPVVISERMKRHIRETTGTFDPYRHVKIKRNQDSAAAVAKVQARIAREKDPLFAALQAATAGNILDTTAGNERLLAEMMERVFSQGFARECYHQFQEALEKAGTILYIGDNAGEIFFDALLVEELVKQGKEVIFCVRGLPAVDDALEEDYRLAGLDRLTRLVTTGNSYQGVVLSEAPGELVTAFNTADLILAKGMGNFETIGDLDEPRLFQAFIAKCKPVADVVGVEVGDFCFIRGGEVQETV